jgi:hypothetical protein
VSELFVAGLVVLVGMGFLTIPIYVVFKKMEK